MQICLDNRVGCPVLGTELHESEAELSVTSVTGRDAVSDSNSQLPSQHLAFINTNILSEANSPGARESIDGELTALQAASQSDGTGGFYEWIVAVVRTSRWRS